MNSRLHILEDKFNKYNWNYKRVLGKNQPYILKNSVTIGIIDSGIDINNPCVSSHTISGFSLVEHSSPFEDITGHGTQVFGVIDTLIKNVEYRIYKIMNDEKTNSLLLIKAIIKAVDEGVDILNISLGIYKDKSQKTDNLIIQSFNKAINYAKDNNVVIISSAGNNGENMDSKSNLIHLPGDHPYVINVGSTNKNNSISYYSNFGSSLNLLAPTGQWIEKNGKIAFSEMILTYGKARGFVKRINDFCNIPYELVLSYGTSLAPPQVVAAFAWVKDKYSPTNLEEWKKIVYNNSEFLSTIKNSELKEVRIK